MLTMIVVCMLMIGAVGVPTQAQTTLYVGMPWDTTIFNGVFVELAKAYQNHRPDVEIEFLSGWGEDKVMAGLAAGVLPDILFGWGNTPLFQQVFTPLDDMMARRGVYLEDYLPGSIGQMHIAGKTWTLQIFIDPNFPLIYNKTMFAEAGLNPDEPPTTVAEFDEIFPRLTRRGVDGQLVQIAMPPWMWKDDGRLFTPLTFGSAFGAELWEGDEDDGWFGLTSSRMVAAYDWLKDYHDQYAADAAGLVGSRFDDFKDRMVRGEQAMVLWVTPQLKELQTMAPSYEWGVAPPFYEENHGFRYPIWFGGWGAGITRLSDHQDEAFDFLVFMSYSDEGQEILARVGDLFPATKESPGFLALIEETPEWFDFINALKVSTLSPATYWLNVDWDKAFALVHQRIFNEGVAPIVALQEAQEQLELMWKQLQEDAVGESF